MKENYKHFIQILVKSIGLICMTFVLFNKYSANASETTQKQSQNINNHYTSTTIKTTILKQKRLKTTI